MKIVTTDGRTLSRLGYVEGAVVEAPPWERKEVCKMKPFWVIEIKQRNGVWAPTAEGDIYITTARWKLNKFQKEVPNRSYRIARYIRKEEFKG